MADLAKIMEQKGRDVIGIDCDASVYDAVRKMVDANVGALLVTRAGGAAVAGIFTERDFLRRVAAEEMDERETRVRDVMSSPVIVVTPDTSVEEAMALMTDKRIRHAPVVDGEQLLGMISIGDLVKHQSQEQSFRLQYLTEYITAG
jgi:CBS domain-containing protein